MSPDTLVSKYLQHFLKKMPKWAWAAGIHKDPPADGTPELQLNGVHCFTLQLQKKKASYDTTARETSNYECEHVAAEAAAYIAAALCTLGK